MVALALKRLRADRSAIRVRNRPGPKAVDDSYQVEFETPTILDVLANDIERGVDINPASVRVMTPPTSGTATAVGDGTISYTPDALYDGPDSFTYMVADIYGRFSDPATVTLSVLASGSTEHINGFAERVTKVIPTSAVRGEGALPAFLARVRITDNKLRTTGNGGLVTSASGHDIQVEDDAGVVWPYYRLAYDGTTGTWTAIVRMTEIGNGTRTIFHVYAGKSGAADGSSGPSTFAGMFAWDILSGADLVGSSNLTVSGLASGTILNVPGATFSDGDAASRTSYNPIAGSTAYTLSFLANPNASMVGTDRGYFGIGAQGGNDAVEPCVLRNDNGGFRGGAVNPIIFSTLTTGGTARLEGPANTHPSGAATMIHAVWESGDLPRLLIDGEPQTPSWVGSIISSVATQNGTVTGGVSTGGKIVWGNSSLNQTYLGDLALCLIRPFGISNNRAGAEWDCINDPDAFFGSSIFHANVADLPPVAVPVFASMGQAQVFFDVDVLAQCVDQAGGTLTITARTDGSNGTTSIQSGKVRYTPSGSFVGTDRFTYTISDGTNTSTSIVEVTVTPAPQSDWVLLAQTIGLTRPAADIIVPTGLDLDGPDVNQFPSVPANRTYDFRDTTFVNEDNNDGNKRRESIVNFNNPGGDLVITGLKQITTIPDDIVWRRRYQSASPYYSSAATVRLGQGGTGRVIWENCWSDGGWDVFRPSGSGNYEFVVRGCYARNTWDNLVENDALHTGIIEDCLIDGARNFLSMNPGGSASNSRVVTIRNSLVRIIRNAFDTALSGGSGEFPDGSVNAGDIPVHGSKYTARFPNGTLTAPGYTGFGYATGSPFKCTPGQAGPVHISDSIFFVESLFYNGPDRMTFPGGRRPSSNVLFEGSCNNVVICWMGDGAYPGGLPATGVTVMTGQPAQDFWDEQRLLWLQVHGCADDTGDDFPWLHTDPDEPPPPPPPPDPPPIGFDIGTDWNTNYLSSIVSGQGSSITQLANGVRLQAGDPPSITQPDGNKNVFIWSKTKLTQANWELIFEMRQIDPGLAGDTQEPAIFVYTQMTGDGSSGHPESIGLWTSDTRTPGYQSFGRGYRFTLDPRGGTEANSGQVRLRQHIASSSSSPQIIVAGDYPANDKNRFLMTQDVWYRYTIQRQGDDVFISQVNLDTNVQKTFTKEDVRLDDYVDGHLGFGVQQGRGCEIRDIAWVELTVDPDVPTDILASPPSPIAKSVGLASGSDLTTLTVNAGDGAGTWSITGGTLAAKVTLSALTGTSVILRTTAALVSGDIGTKTVIVNYNDGTADIDETVTIEVSSLAPTAITSTSGTSFNVSVDTASGVTLTQLNLNQGNGSGAWSKVSGWSKLELSADTGMPVNVRTNAAVTAGNLGPQTAVFQYDGEGLVTPLSITLNLTVVNFEDVPAYDRLIRVSTWADAKAIAQGNRAPTSGEVIDNPGNVSGTIKADKCEWLELADGTYGYSPSGNLATHKITITRVGTNANNAFVFKAQNLSNAGATTGARLGFPCSIEVNGAHNWVYGLVWKDYENIGPNGQGGSVDRMLYVRGDNCRVKRNWFKNWRSLGKLIVDDSSGLQKNNGIAITVQNGALNTIIEYCTAEPKVMNIAAGEIGRRSFIEYFEESNAIVRKILLKNFQGDSSEPDSSHVLNDYPNVVLGIPNYYGAPGNTRTINSYGHRAWMGINLGSSSQSGARTAVNNLVEDVYLVNINIGSKLAIIEVKGSNSTIQRVRWAANGTTQKGQIRWCRTGLGNIMRNCNWEAGSRIEFSDGHPGGTPTAQIIGTRTIPPALGFYIFAGNKPANDTTGQHAACAHYDISGCNLHKVELGAADWVKLYPAKDIEFYGCTLGGVLCDTTAKLEARPTSVVARGGNLAAGAPNPGPASQNITAHPIGSKEQGEPTEITEDDVGYFADL